MKRKSPCYYCTEHRAGCHVPECEHGWWEWHVEQLKEKAARKKRERAENDINACLVRKGKPKPGTAAAIFRKQYNENGGAHE